MRHTLFYEGIQNISDRGYTIEDVLNEKLWVDSGAYNTYKEYNRLDTFWLRVMLINMEPTNETYLFYMQPWAKIDLYLLNKKGETSRLFSGLRRSYKDKSFRDNKNYFELEMAAKDSVLLLAKVFSDYPSVTFPPEQEFYIAQVDRQDYDNNIISNSWLLPFQGFLLTQVIYGLIIFLLIREKIALYFFILSMGNFFYDGFIYPQDSLLQIFPILQVYQLALSNLSAQLIIIGAILFVAEYVDLGKLVRNSRKYLSIFLWFLVLWILLSIWLMYHNYEITRWFNLTLAGGNTLFKFHTGLGLIMVTVGFLLVFFIPLYGLFSKVRFAWLLTISTVFPVLGAVIFNVTSFGNIVGNKIDLYEWANLDAGMSSSYAFIQFGEFLFILVFAIIVGLRAKQLYHERRMALEKQMEIEQKSANDLREVFEATDRFVPHEFIESLGSRQITEVNIGDHVEREVTVMFGDIRNFTSMSENMTAEENFQFIRKFNGIMSPIIHMNKGFINQYLGDGIMSIFPGEPIDALKAAIAMQKQLYKYNQERFLDNLSPVNMGIGFHSGQLVMGIIGDSQRMDVTTIADVVNTASRIESLTKYFGSNILLSEESYRRILASNVPIFGEKIVFRYQGMVQLKGKKNAIGLYECINGDLPHIKQLKAQILTDFQSGIESYYKKEFRNARDYFTECLRVYPEDKSVNFFFKKVKKFLKEGVSETWTGIEQMDSK